MNAAPGLGLVIATGLRVSVRQFPSAVWMYLIGLVSVLPLALAAGWLVHGKFGRSLLSETFAQNFNHVLIAEFLRDRGTALGTGLPLLVGAVIIWGMLSVFLNGAVISAVNGERVADTGELFGGGGRAFGRMLRVMVLGVPFMIGLGLLPILGMWRGAEWLVADWVNEQAVFMVRLGVVCAGALLFAFVNGAYDLMKIEAVARGEWRARYAFARGLRRALGNSWRILCVYFSFVGGGLIITLVTLVLDAQLGRGAWSLAIVGLILQQIVVFVRAMLRMGLIGAELALVKGGSS